MTGFSTIGVDGLAYNIVASDVNRDLLMDIVIANGTYQRLEIYFGDGLGSFSEPTFVEFEAGSDITYALATLDLDTQTTALSFAAAGLASIGGVSRHQLLVHPDIPYTSHNSSLCLDAHVSDGRIDEALEAQAAAAEHLRQDLVFSGFFEVVDPSLYGLVPASAAPALELEDCRISAGPAFPGIKARCGTMLRPENPDDAGSEEIEIAVAVVPALERIRSNAGASSRRSSSRQIALIDLPSEK